DAVTEALLGMKEDRFPGNRRFAVPLRFIEIATSGSGFRLVPAPLVFLEASRKVAMTQSCEGLGIVTFAIVGPERHDPLIAGGRFGVAAKSKECIALVLQRLSVVRFERERALITFERVGVTVKMAQHRAAPIGDFRIARIDLPGAVKRCKGLVIS